MAALSFTKKTERLPVGNRVLQTFEVTTTAAAADEWIATGLSWIDAVVEGGVIGTTPHADVSTSADPVTPNYVLNANGTGVAAGTNAGNLGIETPTAKTVQVTVIGIP